MGMQKAMGTPPGLFQTVAMTDKIALRSKRE
jgi:hypothetical protein